MKYTVLGHAEVTVSIVVDVESEEEAYDTAAAEFGGIQSYCGNGGTDKLIGVSGSHESIAADGQVEFDDILPTD